MPNLLLGRARRPHVRSASLAGRGSLAAKFLDACPKENLARWRHALLTKLRQGAFQGLASVPGAKAPDFTPDGGFARRDVSQP